jgi:hypothetical protein
VKNAIVVVVLLVGAAAMTLFSQAATPEGTRDGTTSVQLLSADLPSGCKEVDGSYPVDIQTEILYDWPPMYQKMLPPLKGKRVQSFECAGVKGSIYYFFFADDTSRQRVTNFVKPLLWGEDRPTKAHPELILGANTTLVVVSFANAPEQLVNALRAKLRIDSKHS